MNLSFLCRYGARRNNCWNTHFFKGVIFPFLLYITEDNNTHAWNMTTVTDGHCPGSTAVNTTGDFQTNIGVLRAISSFSIKSKEAELAQRKLSASQLLLPWLKSFRLR